MKDKSKSNAMEYGKTNKQEREEKKTRNVYRHRCTQNLTVSQKAVLQFNNDIIAPWPQQFSCDICI